MSRFYLILILFFTLVTRLWQVDKPATYIFDEVYHVVSIKAYAENNPAGYEWWHEPPEPNTAYEWLHPPIAKLIQAGSVKIFGDRPMAWRFPSVVFGVLSVLATYYLALILFKKESLALTAAALLALDNLHLTMSRIAMNDIFVTTFILFALVFFFKGLSFAQAKDSPYWKYWYLTGLFAGLALATKHSSIMLYPIFFLFILKGLTLRKSKVKPYWFWRLPFYLALIPLSIYLLSFTQFFLQGHTFADFYHLHQNIWWYQTGLTATHSYQSTALTWPLLWRPVWLHVQYWTDKVGNIYNLGNPAVFWGGLAAVIYQIIKGLILRNSKVRPYGKPLMFVLLAYGLLFLPLSFSPRILFLHHYLPALPLLCIILANVLHKFPKLNTQYLILATFMFFFFYPLNTNIPLPAEWVKYWFWLPNWK
jgi:dolichyl-phosphate-mannose--protein O-mannosyl transferase